MDKGRTIVTTRMCCTSVTHISTSTNTCSSINYDSHSTQMQVHRRNRILMTNMPKHLMTVPLCIKHDVCK